MSAPSKEWKCSTHRYPCGAAQRADGLSSWQPSRVGSASECLSDEKQTVRPWRRADSPWVCLDHASPRRENHSSGLDRITPNRADATADSAPSSSRCRSHGPFASASQIPIKYCVEPRQGIPLVRNKAIENAEGDFVALIDDDEFPTRTWLQTLFTACTKYGVDGVLGPVKRHFDEEPPKWVVKGNFYQRETYRTGLVIDWTKGRTNNTLLRKQIFEGSAHAFDPEIRTGEDMDFFRRMIEKGHAFIWCNEAVVYEAVPDSFSIRRTISRCSLLMTRF